VLDFDPDLLGKLLGSFVPFGSVLDLAVQLSDNMNVGILSSVWLLRKIVAATEERRTQSA
jgi:hypothetical protein